jgi:hypothetical protein
MRAPRLSGNACCMDIFEVTTSRPAPATLLPAVKATRTESSSPNNRKAATMDTRVRMVRVLRRNSAAQIRWKYFMSCSFRLAFPFSPREKVARSAG